MRVVTTLVLVFFFLPYTLLLLLGHKLYRFSGRKYCHWLNRLKPLLDSYYAPYKIHTRYWTGFLLLVRCALYIVFLLNSFTPRKSFLAIILTFTVIGFSVGFACLEESFTQTSHLLEPHCAFSYCSGRSQLRSIGLYTSWTRVCYHMPISFTLSTLPGQLRGWDGKKSGSTAESSQTYWKQMKHHKPPTHHHMIHTESSQKQL